MFFAVWGHVLLWQNITSLQLLKLRLFFFKAMFKFSNCWQLMHVVIITLTSSNSNWMLIFLCSFRTCVIMAHHFLTKVCLFTILCTSSLGMLLTVILFLPSIWTVGVKFSRPSLFIMYSRNFSTHFLIHSISVLFLSLLSLKHPHCLHAPFMAFKSSFFKTISILPQISY